jgi:MFS family permease
VTIGAYTHVIAMLAIGQLLTGFGSYSTYIISYVILSDSFSDKWRQIGIISVNASWAVGEISFCLLYNCFNRWEYFMIGCLVIPLAGWLVLGQFLLIESPVFLLGHSRRKCLVALNKIAAWNNQPPLTLEQIQPSPKPEEQASVFEVFKSWAYIKPILLIGLFATTVNIFYYGTQYCMDDIGSNFGFNMLIVGCLEFSAYFSSSKYCFKT